jgi:hypothetical protein
MCMITQILQKQRIGYGESKCRCQTFLQLERPLPSRAISQAWVPHLDFGKAEWPLLELQFLLLQIKHHAAHKPRPLKMKRSSK